MNTTTVKSKLPLTSNWWRGVLMFEEVNKQTESAGLSVESLLEESEEEEEEEVEVKDRDSRDNDDNKLYNEINISELSRTPSLDLVRGTTLDQYGELDVNIGCLQNKNDGNQSSGHKYELLCEKIGVSSRRRVANILDMMDRSNDEQMEVVLNHCGMDEIGLCVATGIIGNIGFCTRLELEDNILTRRALIVIVGMLNKSQIEFVNLSSTGIAKFGPPILAPWLAKNKYIQYLIMRENKFDDIDGQVLFNAISSNNSLTTVDLSHNQFSVRCGPKLKMMIEENYTLESLNLNWNNLRLVGASNLAAGLKKNIGLKKINVGWNGFGNVGTKEIGKYIRENETVEELNLICNRISDDGLSHLFVGLENNTSLKVLKIGRNNFSQKAIETLFKSLAEDKRFANIGLRTIDLKGNIYLNGLETVIEKLKEVKPELEILYGYEDSYGQRRLNTFDPVGEALQFLRQYTEDNNINLVELFEKFDADGSMSVTYDEFRKGLKDAGIPITEYQVDQLIKYLDSDGDGEIDFSELVVGAEKHAQRAAKMEELNQENVGKQANSEKTTNQINKLSMKTN